MVSHPESVVADRSMALPAAPGPGPGPGPPASVAASRPHHSHRHQHHGRSSRHGSGDGGGGGGPRSTTGRRSHHGGTRSSSSAAQMNEFPIFSATGDVEIVIRAADQERRYLLHRLILAQCSGFFEAGMSEEWSRVQATREREREGEEAESPDTNGSDNGRGDDAEELLSAIDEDADVRGTRRAAEPTSGAHSSSLPRRAGPPATKTRWRYELDWDNREDDAVPILVQMSPSVNNTVFGGEVAAHSPPTARNKPPAPHQGFFRSMANMTGIQSALHLPATAAGPAPEEPPMDPTIRDYDNLFRIFYNHSPRLNSVNIATAYAECKSLLVLADMYDALPVTGPRVDHHLLRFSSRLYKQIAKYPPSYLKLGYLARSRVIFAEALIHVVGQWPAAMPHLGPASYSPVPDLVLDLAEDKVDDLEDEIARIESKLFRLTLTTSKGERVGPSNAYLDWLAVSLFRQWLVENTTPPPTSILKPLPSQQQAGRSASQNNNSNNNNAATAVATTASANASPSSRQPSTSTSTHNTTTTITAPTIPNSGSGPASAHNPNSGTRSKPKQQQPGTPPFSIGRTYRLIGSSSTQAYLPREELKRFLKSHPGSDALYSRENLKRLERKMDEIKRLARELVKPLMRNFLELDLRSLSGSSGSGGGIETGMLLPYLTCTRVSEGDFPWD